MVRNKKPVSNWMLREENYDRKKKPPLRDVLEFLKPFQMSQRCCELKPCYNKSLGTVVTPGEDVQRNLGKLFRQFIISEKKNLNKEFTFNIFLQHT